MFGSFEGKATDDTLQRQLYCKALVYASCGSRLARDWIAGCAALTLSDSELVQLALQHDSSVDDLKRLNEYIAKRRQVFEQKAQQRQAPQGASNVSPSSDFFPPGYRKPSMDSLSPASNTVDDDDSASRVLPLSNEQAATVSRCFVYDAVKAASFHTNSLSPGQIAHLEHCCDVLLLPRCSGGESVQSFLKETISIVEEENELMRDKFRVIEQPGGKV